MRLLVYSSPARGHLYPVMPTLLELRRRGHDVAVRTLSSEIPMLRQHGFSADVIDPAIEKQALADWRARTPLGALARSIDTFARRAALEPDDLDRAVRTEEPDALLVDVNTWGAIAAADAGARPWAIWAPYLLPLPSRDAPPWGLGLVPPRGPAGRMRDLVVGAAVRGVYDRHALPGLNPLRAALGAPELTRATDMVARAPLVLSYTAEPLEYPHSDWPACVHMVGPGVWEPPGPVAPWLAEPGDPIVMVTLSTEYQDDARLARAAMEGLAAERLRVVVTIGGADAADFDPPPNARVERWLAHGAVIERAACVVCHGGMGIVQKALAAGVPVVTVPFGRDQLEVARRVELAGAGVRLPKSRLSAQRVAGAVREAVARTAGARRVAAALAAAGGASAAADAIESGARSTTGKTGTDGYRPKGSWKAPGCR